jgi:hypothetical protein
VLSHFLLLRTTRCPSRLRTRQHADTGPGVARDRQGGWNDRWR